MLKKAFLAGCISAQVCTYAEKTAEDKPKYQHFTFATFLHALMRYENPLPGQTPLRISEPYMWDWKTIHGYPIDWSQNSKHPRRRNFFWVKPGVNTKDVVRAQFNSYLKNHRRFRLTPDSTMDQVIRVWDKSAPENNFAYMRESFPWVDLSKIKLKELVGGQVWSKPEE